MKQGLLLINLGTPDAPDSASIRRYLKQFLSDPRVITLPAPLRYLLLYAFILPFRPKKTAKAYQSIWTQEGSPLLIHSQQLTEKLQNQLGDTCEVVLAMRYGAPAIHQGLRKLQTCEKITVLPLYPQYSSAATGSSIESVLKKIQQNAIIPSLEIIKDFHQHPRFIETQATIIKPFIEAHDHLLLSYHGIPENHILTGECKKLCQIKCDVKAKTNHSCYRAQCHRTTQKLAKQLDLSESQYTTSFQSRLGRTPWIQPYTDKILPMLYQRGVRKLAIACPSFVADCLETLEEIGLQAEQQWRKLGGEKLTLIPSLNDNDQWVDAILDISKLR